jgi:hypothetical protein
MMIKSKVHCGRSYLVRGQPVTLGAKKEFHLKNRGFFLDFGLFLVPEKHFPNPFYGTKRIVSPGFQNVPYT